MLRRRRIPPPLRKGPQQHPPKLPPRPRKLRAEPNPRSRLLFSISSTRAPNQPKALTRIGRISGGNKLTKNRVGSTSFSFSEARERKTRKKRGQIPFFF